MPQYHEINMYSHCVVLASQLPAVAYTYNTVKLDQQQYMDILFVCIVTMMCPFIYTWLCMLSEGW